MKRHYSSNPFHFPLTAIPPPLSHIGSHAYSHHHHQIDDAQHPVSKILRTIHPPTKLLLICRHYWLQAMIAGAERALLCHHRHIPHHRSMKGRYEHPHSPLGRG
jgi:hypothetical protein